MLLLRSALFSRSALVVIFICDVSTLFCNGWKSFRFSVNIMMMMEMEKKKKNKFFFMVFSLTNNDLHSDVFVILICRMGIYDDGWCCYCSALILISGTFDKHNLNFCSDWTALDWTGPNDWNISFCFLFGCCFGIFGGSAVFRNVVPMGLKWNDMLFI